MRISDWSSYVFSSDLSPAHSLRARAAPKSRRRRGGVHPLSAPASASFAQSPTAAPHGDADLFAFLGDRELDDLHLDLLDLFVLQEQRVDDMVGDADRKSTRLNSSH